MSRDFNSGDLPDYGAQPNFELNFDPLGTVSPPPQSTQAAPVPPVQPPVEDADTDTDTDDTDDLTDAPRYRGATNDPTFGYLLALALAVGLSPLISAEQSELRYTIAWLTLASFGVLAWLFGNSARVGQEKPENVLWGISFGLILGVPLLAFGGAILSSAVNLLFGMMSIGTLLAYLIFVMPLSETLFFRAVMQENRPFWMIGLMGALWSVVLYAPHLDLLRFPFVAVVICAVLAMMSMTYSYVRQRNGLAAAWVCQVVVNIVLVFVPFISR